MRRVQRTGQQRMADRMPWRSVGWRLLSVVLYLASGVPVFIWLFNHVLLQLRDGRPKRQAIAASLSAITVGSASLGYVAGVSAWRWLPLPLLFLAGISELRLAATRRRSRGSLPIITSPAPGSLAHPMTTTDLAVIRYEMRCPGWHGRPIRIVHLSDLHFADHLPRSYYQKVLERTRAEAPDLLVYTGDFVSDARFAPLLADLLSGVRGRLATLAILGNHDYWEGAETIARPLRKAGITLLGDGCWRRHIDDSELVVSGYEYPWPDDAGWQAPFLAENQAWLVLTHTPDNIYTLSRAGASAVFAGHYHAGQVRIPLIGPVVMPSKHGRRFDHGHFIVGDTHLFVTAGVGAVTPPFRIYCRPDIFVVDLKGAE